MVKKCFTEPLSSKKMVIALRQKFSAKCAIGDQWFYRRNQLSNRLCPVDLAGSSGEKDSTVRQGLRPSCGDSQEESVEYAVFIRCS
jgi:hypothetical protein